MPVKCQRLKHVKQTGFHPNRYDARSQCVNTQGLGFRGWTAFVCSIVEGGEDGCRQTTVCNCGTRGNWTERRRKGLGLSGGAFRQGSTADWERVAGGLWPSVVR